MGLEEISDQPFLKPFYLTIKTNVATGIVIWCRLQLFYSPEIWDKRSEFQNTFKNNILTKNLFFTDQRYITVLAWRNSIFRVLNFFVSFKFAYMACCLLFSCSFWRAVLSWIFCFLAFSYSAASAFNFESIWGFIFIVFW